MPNLENKIAIIRDVRLKGLAQLRENASSPEKDRTGSASNMVASALRLLAVSEYHLNHDVRAFRELLAECANVRLRMFERYDEGGEISPSYVSMISYKAIFNALAANNIELAKALSERIGGREEVEGEYDRPFDIALGYALKSVVLGGDHSADKSLSLLATECGRSTNQDFRGYELALRGIMNSDARLVRQGLASIVDGHRRQCRAGELFSDMEDELICIWGLGVANLARSRHVVIDALPPLIPADLIS